MSMYADYRKEREGLETLDFDHGFVTYKIFDKECYIQDIYVIKPFRKSGYAAKMADEIARIAKDQGCTVLTGSVCKNAIGADISTSVLECYGMRPIRVIADMTYFMKEIS